MGFESGLGATGQALIVSSSLPETKVVRYGTVGR